MIRATSPEAIARNVRSRRLDAELSLDSALWRELRRGFFDPYRPELHYMRGPGPKWRARYGVADANWRAALVKAL